MTAFFDFRFKKKPVDFSKMKDNLEPNGKGKTRAEEPVTVPERAEAAPKPKEKKPLFSLKKPKGPAITQKMPALPLAKLALVIILLIILAALLLFVVGPKYNPELVKKIGAEKILEKLKIKAPSKEEGLITPEEEAVEELVTVRTYRVVRSDFVDMLPGMGTIKGDREINLRFSINGVIDSMNFFEGDLVRKQDIIATLEQRDLLLKLEYAKSKLKIQETAELAAKKKLEIHQTLYDQGIIIKAKLDEVALEYEGAKSQTQAAQKEVEFALAELDKSYLYSPIDGVMGTRDVEVGEYVTSTVKIASLFDTSTVIAELGVIEKDVNRISLGQKAKINVDTYPGVDFEGKIENIAPIIEGKSRTLTVKIRVKNDNPKGTLLPGMFARIWVSVYEKKNTIKLPYACGKDLNGDGEYDSVYVVGSDNIAKVRPIKVGYGSPDYIEILDGLREGEQVVSEAMAELKDGVKVDVIEVQEPTF